MPFPEAFGEEEKTQEYAVQVSAEIQASPPQIALRWPQDAFAMPDSYTVYRKAPAATAWGPGTVLPGTVTSFVDANISVGTVYEYQIFKTNSALLYSGYGYVSAAIEAPLVEARGRVILVVDGTHAAGLAGELARLEGDLVGDGWTVSRREVARGDSVVSVKSLIQAGYNADPANVKAVFLFGHVPVPYSGNFAADGHAPAHQGAWPADVYYGDMDGTWTDRSVNNTNAEYSRNWNIPGDGKFDQSLLPSEVELQVGRVDLSNFTAFDKSETELLRQYLDKDHNFRHGLITAQRRGLIHDSVGVRDGEAFAASGWRAFAPLFGPDNVTVVPVGQWFPTLTAQSYLWAYGCGGAAFFTIAGLGSSGNYNEGTTWDFATNDTRAVFYMLYGSWLGDWDSTDNIQRATLGTQTYGLACAYSGKPHWFFHHMALGETIGYSTRLTQNNPTNGLYRNKINDAARMVHVALMGDPTLRLHPVAPPSALAGVSDDGGVSLSWEPSTDTVLGYHVYRAATPAGPFARLTSSLVSASFFTDASPSPGTYTYMVRAVKLEQTPSGSYFNGSQGVFATVNVGPATAPFVTVTASDPDASRVGPDPGEFLFTRTGSAGAALDVRYTLGGTAISWEDFRRPQGDMPTVVTMPAGANSTTLTIVPMSANYPVASKLVVLTLAASPGYQVGAPKSATITLAGNGINIAAIRNLPGGDIQLTWLSAPDKIYRVARKNTLSNPAWTDLSGNITATSTNTSWTDTAAGATPQRFYQVYGVN